MKIGVFDPYLDTLGGGEKYMLTAASCLANTHEVSILWDDPDVLQRVNDRFAIDIKKLSIEKNIFRLPFVKKLLESKKYDAIFYLTDGSIPFVLSKLFLHVQFPLLWVNGKSLVNRIKMNRVDKVICNSEFTKSYVDKTLVCSSVVVYPPAGKEDYASTIKKENIILSVGRYSKFASGATFKKQEVMIEVFKKLIDAGLKEWKLVLVVSFRPEDEDEVENLKKTIGKYPIQIITNATNQQLESLYKKAKIYWHAAGFGQDIEKNPELAEHFGIATVQAMHSGAVPIVFGEGGQKEIITNGENGYLWKTEEEWIRQTGEVIKSQQLWKNLSGKAQIRSEAFSDKIFCKNITDIVT